MLIAIAANNKYIHSYKSGIIDAADCTTAVIVDDQYLNAINHGVLAVGYGHDKTTGLDYVLVKNSWNITWGDKGYFKLKLADIESSYDSYYLRGVCGMSTYVTYYPVLN